MNNTGDNLVFLSFLFHPYGYPHVWIVCGWCVTPSKDDHDNTVDESLSVGYIKETNPHNPHSPTSHGRPLHNLPSGSEAESRGNYRVSTASTTPMTTTTFLSILNLSKDLAMTAVDTSRTV